MKSARRLFVVSGVLAYIAFEGTPAITQNAASIGTDRPTYVAGEPVTIIGHDFAAGEIVTVQITHADGTAESGMGHEPTTAVVGADGTFQATWTIAAADIAGPQLVATVSGNASGSVTPAAFVRTASVTTDKGDYQPGETAVITALGFAPNEPVQLQVVHANGQTDGNGHQPFYATADGEGAVSATWFVDPDDSLGSRFLLTATGVQSRVVGSAMFWDASPNIVISQVYGGGGNNGATLTHDFIELFNRGSAPVSLAGWSVQYASATGAGNFGANAGQLTELPPVSLAPGQYLLIQEASNAAVGSPLPTPDVTDSTPIAMAAGAGKVALVDTALPLGCNGGSTPCSAAQLAHIIDLVGYGTGTSGANFFEGTAPAPTLTAITAAIRKSNGCTDTDDNGADFVAGTPVPRNTSSATAPCVPLSPSVNLSLSTNSASEAAQTVVTVTATASAPVTGSQTVNVGVSGTNVTAADYILSNSVITIASGATTGSVTFTVVDDMLVEGSETATLTISSPSSGITLGATTSQSITIADNDAADTPPEVSSVDPANGAINVALNQDITVTFSEPVNLSDPWFSLMCATSGPHAAIVSGGSTSFTLNPSSNFVYGEQCTLTIDKMKVSDQDSNDPPDNMAADFTATFTITPDPCTQPFTHTYQIQGSGLSAAITGTVKTQGVVVGDFEGDASQQGFFLQDVSGDGNPATSDGIFVFTGSANLVSAGQVVRVTGFARERFSQTTINGSNSNTAAVPAANIVNCGTGSVAVTDVSMPFASATDPERFEGMLVRFPQNLVISEYFNYDRFGELVLALPLDGESRPFTGTAIDQPGAAANARTLANSLRRITLDDAKSAQNPTVLRHPNGDPFTLSNKFRGGDKVQNAVGILGFDFSLYRIFPTGPATFTLANPRPASPEPVGGTIRVAAMNTLNFFVTANYPTGDPLDNKCGPSNNMECRGWDFDQPTEFTRQRDKLLKALSGLNGDIIGLNELENTAGVEPLASIVSGLPGYAYVNTGTIGTDAIKVGLIYRPAVVTPVGAFNVLTTAIDPRFIDTKNRPSLAQTFEVNATHARFTVVVNHLKSKGSDCSDVGDPDLGDGQGNCSQTRKAAAQALMDWLGTDPTGSGDPDFLILGDLNSYAREQTLDAIKAGADDTPGTADDYTNLISLFHGAYAYSYTFDGQAGYLDHALANASMLGQVTGAADWHINSDEPDVLDYDTSFKPAEQEALYENDAYRTSDHDPVVVGLAPNAPVVSTPTISSEPSVKDTAVSASATFTETPPDAPFTCTVDYGDGSGALPGTVVANTCSGPNHIYVVVGSYVVTVSVKDKYGATGSNSKTHAVIFAFSGFFQPVDNLPVLNLVTAGRGVPVKFSLGGNQGLNIFAAGYPRSEQIPCESSAAVEGVEETVTAGSSSLSFDATAGKYNYVWKTDKAWAGTCRQLVVKFIEGTTQRANFKFVK